MRAWRQMVVLMTILGLVALVGPAAAIASGPSAGDQQYIDPLGGSHTGSHHSGGGGPSSSTGSAPATSPSATPTTPSPSATVSSSGTTTTASATPTPTTASSTAAGADPPKSLPRTGFDAWLAVVLGVGMLGSGLILRRIHHH